MLKIIIVFLLAITLIACTSSPTTFSVGGEVLPPQGCIDYILRGGKC